VSAGAKAVSPVTGLGGPIRSWSAGDSRAWLHLSPLVLWLGAGFALPLAVVALLSLQPAGEPFSPVGLDLTPEHYAQLLGDGYYLGILGRTLLLAVGVTTACVVLGYPVAAWLARVPGRWKSLAIALVLVPLLTNVVVRSLGVMLLLAPGGIVSGLLGLMGFGDVRLLFTWFAVGLALTQVFLPYMVMALYDGLQGQDGRLVEASNGLGAGPARTFFGVTLPLSLPALRGGIVVVFLLSSTAYVSATLLGGKKVLVSGMLVMQEAMALLNYPFAAALAMVMLACSVLATVIVNTGVGRLTPWTAGRPTRLSGPLLGPALAAPAWRAADVLGPWIYRALLALGLALLLFPMALVVVASVNDVPQATVAGFHGFTWRWYGLVLDNERYLQALLVSAQLAGATVLVALLITVPAAFALVRHRIPRLELVVALLMLPLALPGIAKAVGMLKLLQWFNQIPPFLGLLLVHVVMVSPFMLAMLRASVAGLDRSLEEASQGLGSRPVTTLVRVILPQLAPGLVAAGVIGFLISFGEVTVTAFLVTAQMQTLPVRIYAEATFSLENTVNAVSTLIIAATVLCLALLGRLVRLDHAWRR
jgi:ABC-type spermidine/putrescine transport system permease subunit II